MRIDIQREGRTTVDGWDVSTIVFNGRMETVAFGPNGEQVDVFADSHEAAVREFRRMRASEAMRAVDAGAWEEA